MPTQNRFILFVQNHKRLLVIVVPIVLLFALAGSLYFVGKYKKTNTETVNHVSTKPVAATVASLVNGVMVSSDIANRRVVATMIENSPDARPQAGLINADVVYEDTVEGGITRFMAIFQQDQAAKVGPVRSARSYYIDWLSEYDGIYMHAGGSPTALARIGEYGIKDYPHASNDSYWRIPKAGLASEHTLYANVAKVFQYATSKNKWSTTNNVVSWLFKDALASPSTTGTVTVNFSTPNYQTAWDFDATTHLYSRKLAGAAHKDQITNEQIRASSVVVMTVQRASNSPYSSGKESEWTQTTIGSGVASVFIDGTRIDGTWKKASRTDRTKFFDASGKEIALNRGKIWIEVIPQTGSVTFTPTTVPATATQ